MEQFKICGLKVSCEFNYPMMKERSRKYLCPFEGEPDIKVQLNNGEIDRLRNMYPQLTENECEVMATTDMFYGRLLGFDGFMLHSSAVVADGKAYLFSAPSGTGKSTHTEQWLKLLGERAYILNDDKPAIRIIDGRAFACGTPWSGKSDLNRNEIVPLQGICLLERSENNFIGRCDGGKAVFSILNQTIRPPVEKHMDRLLSTLDRVLGNVPVWKMGCNISTEAAAMAFEAMNGYDS
jgi:hypothetical protein